MSRPVIRALDQRLDHPFGNTAGVKCISPIPDGRIDGVKVQLLQMLQGSGEAIALKQYITINICQPDP